MFSHFLRVILARKYSQNVNSDKNFLLWLQSAYGRLSLFVSAAVLIFFLYPKSLPFVLSAITLITLFPSQRWNILLACSLTVWLFTDNLGWSQFVFDPPANVHPLLYRLFLIAVTTLILSVILLWSRSQKFGWRHLIPIILISYFILVWFFLFNGIRSGFQFHILILFGNFVWFLIFALKFQQRIELNIPHQLGSFVPFWQVTYSTLPVPHGPQYLAEVEAKTPDQFAESQIRGIRLLVWATTLELVFRGISYLVYNPSNQLLPGMNSILKTNALADASIPFIVTSITMVFITLGLKFVSFWGLFIGIARLSGFNAFRAVYKPFLATSFNDFWSRIEHYYVRINLILFIVPFSKFAIRMGVKKQFRFLATILGTMFCGIFFHFFRDVKIFSGLPIEQVVAMFAKNTFYYFLLGVFVSLNIRFRKSKPPPETFTEAILGYSKVLIAFLIVFFGFYFHRLSFEDIVTGLSRFLSERQL